ARPAHPLCGREQLNVGIVRAGDYVNRLPTPATITGTWRWPPGRTHQDVRAEMQGLCDRLAKESGLEFHVSFEGQREPFETPRDHPLVRAVEKAGQTVTGRAPEIIGMALVSDANLYANEAGTPVVCYGPAYETAHSDHERVSVESLVRCAKIYAEAAMNYCGIAA
ncbi:MAG: M20/M25/M40 family metallo-hydrolase, partial [Acidobacteria bacterium]|nr:M20/M25/M40 family metallo-hydrolase [Acidobacteriota bacterium]